MPPTLEKTKAFMGTFLFKFFFCGNLAFNSVLFESIAHKDGFSSASTGLLFMLPYTVTLLLGPTVSFLMHYISPRILATLGGFLFGSGYFCSGMLPLQPIYMYPCFILSGMGLAIVNLPSIWFLEKSFGVNFRSIMPFAVLSTFLSMAIIPNVAAYSEKEYGTGSTLLLFGATGWHLIPCGLLLPSSISLARCNYRQNRKMRADGCRCLQEHRTESDFSGSFLSNYMTLLKEAIWSMFSMLTDKAFLIFLIVTNLRKTPNDVWAFLWIRRAQGSGISLQAAAAAYSTGGIGGFFGMVVAALSFKTSEDTSLILFCFYFIINGFIFITTEILTLQSVWLLWFASFSVGMFFSAQSGMASGVLHLLTTQEQYVSAYGLVELCKGMYSLLDGVVPGILLDYEVGFKTVFIAVGLLSISNGFFVLILGFLVNFKKRLN